MNIQRFIFLIFIGIFSATAGLSSLKEYLDDVNEHSPISMSTAHKRRIIKYYHGNRLGPDNMATPAELEASHKDFDSRRAALIKEWEENMDMAWPTYSKATPCFSNGACDWKKKGYKLDAHHVIPQSHKGPNEWWVLWPLSTTEHSWIHSSKNCCTLFPLSCGGRTVAETREEFIDDIHKGWTFNASRHTRTRDILGTEVAITKVERRGKSDYYKLTIGEKAAGKSFSKLEDAQAYAVDVLSEKSKRKKKK